MIKNNQIERIPKISEDFYATNGDNRVYETINALVDVVNKLNTKEEKCCDNGNFGQEHECLKEEGVDIKLCPIHDNTHYCKYKIGDGCKCKCTCTREEKPAGSLDEMAGYDPLSTYKARLRERVNKLEEIRDPGRVPLLLKYDVLYIIDEE